MSHLFSFDPDKEPTLAPCVHCKWAMHITRIKWVSCYECIYRRYNHEIAIRTPAELAKARAFWEMKHKQIMIVTPTMTPSSSSH